MPFAVCSYDTTEPQDSFKCIVIEVSRETTWRELQISIIRDTKRGQARFLITISYIYHSYYMQGMRLMNRKIKLMSNMLISSSFRYCHH
jgi:hypothetical protein